MQKTIKRLALVASAAVAFAGITGVAAHAGTASATGGVWAAASGGVYAGSGATSASQIGRAHV